MKKLLDPTLPRTIDVPPKRRRPLAFRGIFRSGQRCSGCESPARLAVRITLAEDVDCLTAVHHVMCARCVRRMWRALAKVRP